MDKKQLRTTDIFTRFSLALNTWFHLIAYQNFEFVGENVDYSYVVTSDLLEVRSYRPRSGLISSKLTIIRKSNSADGVSSNSQFSAVFQTFSHGKLDFVLVKEDLIGEYNADWHRFNRKSFFNSGNVINSSLYDAFTEVQLNLLNDLLALNPDFNQVNFF